MKYNERSNTYRASNVTFNPKTLDAHSYDWWRFVAKISGKIVFNNYRYSSTTARHQRKVLELLRELDIKVDLTVQLPKGIEAGATLKSIKALHQLELKRQAELLEAKRIKRNAVAAKRRLTKKLEHYLENVLHFRDYEIVDQSRFGRAGDHIASKIAVHQCVDAKTLEHDADTAIYNFQRDGFSTVVFYV